MTGRSFACGAVGLALLAAAGTAHADPLPARAEPIFSPGRNAASEDTTEALLLNPANLAFLPAWELRWTGLHCPDSAQKVGCGNAFTAGTPLLFDISTAARVDYVQPPWGQRGEGVGFPFRGYDYTWVTWGLGIALGESLAFGLSLQHSYSPNSYVNDLWGITAGLGFRPNSHFAFGIVAHDFNGPSTQILPSGLPVLDQSYVFSMAFRPTGKRELEIGLEAKYLQGSDQWLPRATLAFDASYLRIRGDIEAAHLPNDNARGIVGTVGLEVAYDRYTAGAGMVMGNGLGDPSTLGVYGTASISGYRTPGVPRRQRAVYFRLEGTPSPRGHINFLKKLWAIAEDKEIASVTGNLGRKHDFTSAKAQSLLGWKPRPTEETVLDCARSLIAEGVA